MTRFASCLDSGFTGCSVAGLVIVILIATC
jgi:hypothetical protein